MDIPNKVNIITIRLSQNKAQFQPTTQLQNLAGTKVSTKIDLCELYPLTFTNFFCCPLGQLFWQH